MPIREYQENYAMGNFRYNWIRYMQQKKKNPTYSQYPITKYANRFKYVIPTQRIFI